MNNRERFLERLAQEAGSRMSPHEVVTLVDEARAHLEDDVQARLELGAPADVAEREALAAFGKAKAVGREIRRHEPVLDRECLVVFLGLAIFLAATRLILPGPGWTVVYGLLLAALIVTSLRAKRPQFLAFLLVFGPLCLGMAVLLSTQIVMVNRLGLDGPLRYERATIPGILIRDRVAIWRDQDEAVVLVRDEAEYLKGQSNLVPLNETGRFSPDGTLRLRFELNREIGEAVWRTAIERGLRSIGVDETQRYEEARLISELSRRSWWAEVPSLIVPLAVRLKLFDALLLYGGGHLLLWLLGCAWRGDRLRRDPRRGHCE